MKYVVERKKDYFVTEYHKMVSSEQHISSSQNVKKALKFVTEKEAKALAILVNGKVKKIEEE